MCRSNSINVRFSVCVTRRIADLGATDNAVKEHYRAYFPEAGGVARRRHRVRRPGAGVLPNTLVEPTLVDHFTEEERRGRLVPDRHPDEHATCYVVQGGVSWSSPPAAIAAAKSGCSSASRRDPARYDYETAWSPAQLAEPERSGSCARNRQDPA
jgi:hypothetical protein